MSTEDVKQIKLARGSVGVVGLPELLEQARSRPFSSDEELKCFLLRGIKANNFVAPGTEDEYADALFREYKKFVGEPLPEQPSGVLEVRILGPGSPRCRSLEEATMAALAEPKVAADLRHVTNLAEIVQYGILVTPALVINGKVKSAGRVLSKEQVKKLIAAETRRRETQPLKKGFWGLTRPTCDYISIFRFIEFTWETSPKQTIRRQRCWCLVLAEEVMPCGNF